MTKQNFLFGAPTTTNKERNQSKELLQFDYFILKLTRKFNKVKVCRKIFHFANQVTI